ncbi:DUF1345 domain-containing protein [Hephaestia sp. GCM10023244]|uniref:DUF1345 domain-containing protein n=1 Tax=unclassified Hephaestia TaxID=2631281 RepID=UPI0020779B68|nr:DUF1345 domain-containing protein [Hephaestia sp. MAHUQ-44]MCM8730899.1 DUF1345 domain-containing protein [Hephaestia sp. MAHUQ-44]
MNARSRTAADAAIAKRIAPARFVLFGVVLVAGTMVASVLGASARIAPLIGFDAAALAFLAALASLFNDDAATMRRTAAANDARRGGLLVLTVLISLVVLVAVGTLIAGKSTLDWPAIALIVITLALAWLFANSVFMLHYAHLYYLGGDGGGDRGGLDMPKTPTPDYWDFLYFSFTLGMTFQTSDIAITGAHIRRVALIQSMAAFVFNMGILAFSVNALGGMG